jgi:hypothetical protein
MQTSIFKFKLSHVGEVGAPTRGREEVVIEHDIGIEVAGEYQPSHHQVGADDPHPGIPARRQLENW